MLQNGLVLKCHQWISSPYAPAYRKEIRISHLIPSVLLFNFDLPLVHLNVQARK